MTRPPSEIAFPFQEDNLILNIEISGFHEECLLGLEPIRTPRKVNKKGLIAPARKFEVALGSQI